MKSCLVAALIYGAISALSWIITVGIIYLITLCFGWTFSWLIATGVWLVMFLAKAVFGHRSSK